MSEKPVEGRPWGRLRAIYERLTYTPAPDSRPSGATDALGEAAGRIGRYSIQRKLGQGGMGVVYAALDDRLERTVALKTMSSPAGDETARSRFWREARAAASVNHPNICQIHEIGEADGQLFIAMELLDGESLADRLQRGAMNVSQAVPTGLSILAALSALHARGIVHRDLKPSNVFLTSHGVKLLDFGLATPGTEAAATTEVGLTMPGVIVGTPRYMAPEQLTGDTVDARSDLFSFGAVLFEMLAGRPAFAGRTNREILHATLNEQPPALSGSPAVAAVDRVIRRAMAKRPADRPDTADELMVELGAVRGASGDTAEVPAAMLTRIVVLPFRVLRPDPDSDFLAFSLPDAIAISLKSIDGVIVRSSAAAARFAGETPDLRAVSAELDVDRVVTGSLMRSGDALRVTAQLVEAPSGTLMTSETVQSSMGELFELQDDIARRVVRALSLPLSSGGASPSPDAPHDARAYELYLRANELAQTYDGLPRARDTYERCIERDPRFAPAWAHLGRCHRVIGKYIQPTPDSETRAEQAFQRALELNPRLSIAHKFYANLEADIGESLRAMVRLLGEASRHGNDPELFAGLVHACRYCGLYDESIAAHAEARRLDPGVQTSLEQTLHMSGNLDRLLGIEPPVVIAGADDGIRVIALGLSGRRDEALERLSRMRRASHLPAFQAWTKYLAAWLERRPQDMWVDAHLARLKVNDDPEAIFQEGWLFLDIGERERGVGLIARAVAKGYYVVPTLASRPQFEPLRGDPGFERIVAEAEEGRARARRAFHEAGGDRLLGRP